jgi:predicted PurR-regulated permease PerM
MTSKLQTVEKFYTLTIFILGVCVVYFAWPYISKMVVILVFAFLITTILLPAVDTLERKINSRLFSTFFVMSGVLILVFGFLFGFASGMFQQSSEFYFRLTEVNDLNSMYESTVSSLPGFSSMSDGETPQLAERIQTFISGFIQQILSIAKSGVNFIFLTAIILVFTFILLVEYHHFRRTLVALVPNKYFEVGVRIIHNIEMQMSRYLTGQFLAASSVAILSFIGLFILNLYGANLTLIVFISIIAGLSNLIPMVGPFVGMVPAVLIAIMNNLGSESALSHLMFNLVPSPFFIFDIILMFVIVQQIDNNFITPVLVGESVGLHPMLVMISLFIGGTVVGPLGMLFAVPTAGVIKVISQEVVFLVRYAHLL